ncbi:capsule biosynthesis protein CapA [Clostridium homopropionicum DSM 5847]|uniref:Capsule biosynthesis protein CapA n=1 Tax=Clostridium homopropionicum DSM 5847 TaxID=1121318 RepID=A0A0L6Z9D0_9CLOT|nr:CapA family protein [Clostridium homopropionicum]KOA19393.1 capsule biosynthesis protein CapA [Clostridium homopropionicum DSM 5847]SFG68398.1 poly-gamma-glutamate synthesis protein (capsule biosynthesis protein) [Clostridium homopropionicum]
MQNRKRKRSRKIKKRRLFMLLLIIFLVISLPFAIYMFSSKHTTFSLFLNLFKGKSQTSNLILKDAEPEDNTKMITPNKKVDTEKSSQKPTYTEILLSSTGDCTLGSDDKYSYEDSLPHVLKKNNNDYSYFFKNVYSIFSSDDITTVNFEGTLTNSSTKADKQFAFKAPPEYAKILSSSSIEGVNLSNNHIFDYLNIGFKDTKEALKKENIKYFGEGNTWIEEVKGVKLGFLGYKGYYNSKELQNKIKNDISELKSKNCIIIINFHWGDEGSYEPNSTQKSLAHFAIDNGADLIIGHHPHVLQGIEKYKNRIICYSMGNFSFGGNKNPSDKDTMIVQVKFKTQNSMLKSYDLKVIPCKISSVNYINDYRPTPVSGNKKEELLNKINNLSKNLGFKLDGNFYNIPIN